MKRIVPMILILSLIIQSSLIGYANQNSKNEFFSDIKGHWAEETIKRHHKKGLLNGYPDGTFRPNDQMKRSELITLINKYFGLKEKSEKNFIDVSGEKWYANETAKAKYYGYLEDLAARPEEPATREDVVNMVSLILDTEEQNSKFQKKEFKDLKDVNEETQEKIEKFSEVGYIKGYEDNTFKPKGIINRAEIMTIAENILGYIVTSQEDIDNMPENVGKITIINPNITIENKEIKGDIYISPGVNGKVTMKNTKIKGQIDVSGGTIKNPITLENVDIKKVVITKVKETPQVKIIGKSKVDELKTKSEAKIEISGKTKVKEIKTESKTDLKLDKGVEVEKLIIEAETKVETKKGSIIENLETKKKTEVIGQGTIKKAQIKNKDVEIEKKPEYIKIDDKVKEIKVENKKMNHTNDDYNTEESIDNDSDNDDDSNDNDSNDLKDTTPPKWLTTPSAEMKTSQLKIKIATKLDEEATVYYSVYESKYDGEIEFTVDQLINNGNSYDAGANTVTQEVYSNGIKPERSYNVYLVAVDKNNNKQKTVEKIKVTEIDTTKPDTPTADIAEGLYNENKDIELLAEEGANIYYTIDGSKPTKESKKYEGKIKITEPRTTIKAIAVDEAGNMSDVFTITYEIDKDGPNAPTADVAAGIYNENKDIELSAEEGATIYYTVDGSEPTKESKKYEEKIKITKPKTTIKAIAVDEAGNRSGVLTITYEIDKDVPNAPTADVKPKAYNTNQKVKLASDEGTIIYYTVDGSEPTKNSSEYKEGMEIEITDTTKPTIIKAIAVDKAGNTSGVFTGEYIIDKVKPDAPKSDVAEGLYNEDQDIKLSAEKDASIYYTLSLDGIEPTIESDKYKETIKITEPRTTIKAIAVDEASNISDVFTITYEIDKKAPNAPTVDVEPKAYNTNQKVKLTSDEGATIYYTVDESEPTKESILYKEGMEIEITDTTKPTTIKAIAVDKAGNRSGVFTGEYIIDKTPPNPPTSNVSEGSYRITQNVGLTSEKRATIYYTLDESEPTKDSSKYTGTIQIAETKTIKAIAIDEAGNKSSIVEITYTIEDGTPENPYTVKTIDELDKMSGNKHYKLMNDIDFKNPSNYEGGVIDTRYTTGEGWKPKALDGGSLDGNGKTISNLYINRPSEEKIGLFSTLENSTIKNMKLSNINIIADSYVGGLAGEIENGTIKNVGLSDVNITGKGAVAVGGLVGNIKNKSVIEKSYVVGKVNTDTNSFSAWIGGLIGGTGTQDDSRIEVKSSYAVVDVSVKGGNTTNYIGGLIGSAQSTNLLVENCYIIGSVTAKDNSNSRNIGGLIGQMGGKKHFSIKNNYVAVTIESASNSVGGLIGKGANYNDNVEFDITNNIAYNYNIKGKDYVGSIIGHSYYDGTKTTEIANNNYKYKNMNISANDTSNSVSGKNISNINNQTIDPLNTWDFTNTWEIKEGADRPTLRGVGNDDGKLPLKVKDGYF